jgi:hypothetical protein
MSRGPVSRAAPSAPALLFAFAMALVSAWATPVMAQAPDSVAVTVPDSAVIATPVAQAPTAQAEPRVTSTLRRTGVELNRFELGVGAVKGFFDVVGSLGYRRYLSEGTIFERSLMLELTGAAKNQVTEGAFSLYFLMRPLATYKTSWRLRPLIEFGPGAHTVVQVASLSGLNRTRYASHVYVKTHAYAGFEALLTNRFGILVRGRVSIPSHRPLDYAQAAIFLR